MGIKSIGSVPYDRRKLFTAALIIFIFSFAKILILILIKEPISLIWEQYLVGEITSASFITFFTAIELFLPAFNFTERMPHNWKRALLRTGVGAVLLTPGVFMDPAMVISTFVPNVIPALCYALVAIKSLSTGVFLFTILFAFPIWIVWSGSTLVAAIRTRN